MATAPVGDDVYGEDPSINELEARTAELLGHEAGLFCPSGSMANMLGVWSLVPVGREILCDRRAHIVRAEMGAHAALNGITMRTWTSSSGTPGIARTSDITDLLELGCGPYLVETAAIEIENTHNFGGGTIHPIETLREIREICRQGGVAMHLDGARLWNAHVATGVPMREYGSLFDTVSVCYSKGMGAPVGSVLVSSAQRIAKARIQRKRLGGGMRQAGILAAAGLYALDHHVERLADDHAEATRLAEGLAALRGQPMPGLEEINEAIVTVICMGEDAPLRLIDEELTVGHVLGQVPADVPQVPLQRDIEQQQKSLRLKPEAASKLLALDLRKDMDLARSHFLHRLRLLGIDWGVRATDAQRNRGTFRESWQLQWEPELAVRIIEASVHGATVAQAATARLRSSLTPETSLPEIAQAIDDALLADLPQLVEALIATLAQRAATTGDVAQLLQALPPLANVYRYGSVRQTDTALLAGVIDSLMLRAAIGLPVACMAMDEDAAAAMKTKVLAAHEALRLRTSDGEAQQAVDAWRLALRSLAMGDAAAALLRGMACRLLLDEQLLESAEIVRQFNRNLSLGAAPMDVAAWLDGFLNQQALVLMHDEAIWGAVDAWLTGLGEVQFAQILPLVRRSFANFSNHERQSLGEKAKRAPVAGGAAVLPAVGAADDAAPWDESRALRALPVVNELLGLNLPQALMGQAQAATDFDAAAAKV